MTLTIGLVANVYQEANALSGWLEAHLGFFDDVRVLHAGPGGAYSTDGTIEILERWRVPHGFCAIDDGFGSVRTRALRMCPCDYVMLLDADERFYAIHRVMVCDGKPTPQAEVDRILQLYDDRGRRGPPDWAEIGKLGADLVVKDRGEVYDQGTLLRALLEEQRPDAVATIRRHWHDLGFRRPTQHWRLEPDWQVRLLRNSFSIYFTPETRMHEQLVGAKEMSRADILYGPFFDHHHLFFKRMETAQRSHDVDIYDKINAGEKPLSEEEFRRKRGYEE